jgi:hypothetical protein
MSERTATQPREIAGGTDGLWTLPWRKMDSNRRSRSQDTPGLFRLGVRYQKVERVGLEPLFDLSGTESSDPDPPSPSQADFRTCTADRVLPESLSSQSFRAG